MAISTVKISSKVAAGFKITNKGSHSFIIDQPIEAGGGDEGPNPLEVFLSTLGACICTLGRIISQQKNLGIKEIEVDVEGDIDKDFLMGKTTEGRAGFTEIRSFVKINANLTEEQKQELTNEINLRCPIADNILNVSVIKSTVAI